MPYRDMPYRQVPKNVRYDTRMGREKGDMKKISKTVLVILILIIFAVLAARKILPEAGIDTLLSAGGGKRPDMDDDATYIILKPDKATGQVTGPAGNNAGKPDDDEENYGDGDGKSGDGTEYLINEEGTTVAERIRPPEGFERVEPEAGSFGEFLRNLPLKPHGAKVRYFDGRVKPWDVHAAVIDMDVGEKDLQQCADAVIRLRAEYLYSKGLYDRIHFNFTSGFNAEYKKWMEGYRIRVSGNEAQWVKREDRDAGYESFRKYLDIVFAYAGTMSLSREMEKTDPQDLEPGDVFLEGGRPGHCVIVVDMAENPETGEKVFIIAQSYMPAQDIHILKNPSKDDGDPWYPADFGDTLVTPDWTFTADQLYRFADADT